MRRARVSSEYLGRKGRKRCRNELEGVDFGPSKARIMTSIVPNNYSYGPMISFAGDPDSNAAAAVAARVMTRRMAKEMNMVGGFLEVKQEPLLLQAPVLPEEVIVKVETMVTLVKAEPKKDVMNEEDKSTTVAVAAAEELGAAHHESEEGSGDSGEDGGAPLALAMKGFLGCDDEFEDWMIDWNAWIYEQEDRTWWGNWYWDWNWYPYSDAIRIHNGINWASYSLDNEELAEWEFNIWDWA